MRITVHRRTITTLLFISYTLFLLAQTPTDSVTLFKPFDPLQATKENNCSNLCEKDYEEAAEKLNIEVATIKAVVEIEAGNKLKGLHAPNTPIINFDGTMFRRFLKAAKINASKYTHSHATAFSRVNIKKYGSYIDAQYARLNCARTIDVEVANKSSFWGMFQIGGFNWKKCGADSLSDFVAKMSDSEHAQLELFVNFLNNSNMTKYLKTKNWKAFARAYNGASAIKRGYHTRLARAYAKHSK